MVTEIDRQIEQAYQKMLDESRQHSRLEYRYGNNTLVEQIPFPRSYKFTDDYIGIRQTDPALQEMIRLTATKPGKYKPSRGISYHPNSTTPETPFVCQFQFPLQGGGYFLGKTTTSEIVVNPDLELEEDKLEIRENASPVMHVWGNIPIHVCLEAGCHSDESCRTSTFLTAMPVETEVLDPTKAYLDSVDLGINTAGLSEVSRAFLLRAVLKQDFSPFNRDMNMYRDDFTVFESVKRLGLATFSPRAATFDLTNGQTGFNIGKGERYIEMHVPFDVERLGNFGVVKETPKTFSLAADYILLHNLRTKYMIGITYERLARLTERFGFTTFEAGLDREVEKKFEEFFKKENPRGKKGYEMGKILVAFQETDKFLDRFAA